MGTAVAAQVVASPENKEVQMPPSMLLGARQIDWDDLLCRWVNRSLFAYQRIDLACSDA